MPLEEAEALASPPAAGEGEGEGDLVALDAALDRLAQVHARPSQVVELRFFGGMEMRDIAEVLQINSRTADRDWQFARAWLHRELGDRHDPLPAHADLV